MSSINFTFGLHDCSGIKILDESLIFPQLGEIKNYVEYVDTIEQYSSLKTKKSLKHEISKYAQINDTLASINKSIFTINGSFVIDVRLNTEKRFTYIKNMFEKRLNQLIDHEIPMTRGQFAIFTKIVESIIKKYNSFTEDLIDTLFSNEITYQADISNDHFLIKEVTEWYTIYQSTSLHNLKTLLKKMCLYNFYNGDVIILYLLEKRNKLITELKISENIITGCYEKLKKDIKLFDTIQINGYIGLIPEFRFDILYDDTSSSYIKDIHDVICSIDDAKTWVYSDGSILSNHPMLEKITNHQYFRNSSLTGNSISYAFVILKHIYTKGWDQFVKDVMISRGF